MNRNRWPGAKPSRLLGASHSWLTQGARGALGKLPVLPTGGGAEPPAVAGPGQASSPHSAFGTHACLIGRRADLTIAPQHSTVEGELLCARKTDQERCSMPVFLKLLNVTVDVTWNSNPTPSLSITPGPLPHPLPTPPSHSRGRGGDLSPARAMWAFVTSFAGHAERTSP